jgi:hypothetical protein
MFQRIADKQRGRRQTMKQLARFKIAMLAAVLLAFQPVCSAQTATHKKKAPPKPEPTAPELFEYIRGALLSLSPEDGINDNLEVSYDLTKSVLTVTQPGGHCDEFFGALNANEVVWDDFDPSDARNSRERLVRVTLVSVSEKTARACYDKANQVETSAPPNRVRLLFSYVKADQRPKFQESMTKAIKKLIALSGGAAEKDIF